MSSGAEGAFPSAAASSCCPVGSWPGYWGGEAGSEWVVRNTGGCAQRPARTFVRLRHKCLQPSGPRTLPQCLVANATLIERLRDASVLMLGDSTSAKLLTDACSAFKQPLRTWIHPPKTLKNLSKYRHRLSSADQTMCTLLGGPRASDGAASGAPLQKRLNLPLGSFSHYGVGDDPRRFWAYAYPLPPWLGATSFEQVRRDVPAFRNVTGGADPSLIVVGSGFWDIAALWQHEGNFSRRWFVPTAEHARRYAVGARRLVEALRLEFPRSSVVWRTMHPGMKHSITPRVVADFNRAFRAAASELSPPLALLEGETMLQQLTPREYLPRSKTPIYGTSDGRHLWPYLNVALLNQVLNLLQQAVEEGAVCAQ